jgi:GDP-L-fucose synthase
LIRKVVEAREAQREVIEVWGTGKATREFLFVRDAARAIVMATKRYNAAQPLNVGSGEEISIRDLAKTICGLGDFQGHLRFDPTQPEGPSRCSLDTSRALQQLGFRATTSLHQGLAETVAWFTKHRRKLDDRRAA